VANNLIIYVKQGKDAGDKNGVVEAIKALGQTSRLHGSLWYASSDKTAAEALAAVKASVGQTDTVFVADATNNAAEWVNAKGQDGKNVRKFWSRR